MRKINLPLGVALAALGIAGYLQPSPLFALFEVGALLSTLHLASGAAALIVTTQGIGAMRRVGKWLGFFYLALAVVGFITPDVAGVVRLNTPDNLLHLALALPFLYIGLIAPPDL